MIGSGCAAVGGTPVGGAKPTLADVVRTMLVIATTPPTEALLFPPDVARPALDDLLEYLSEGWKVGAPLAFNRHNL